MTSQKDMPKIRLEQYKRYLKKEEIFVPPSSHDSGKTEGYTNSHLCLCTGADAECLYHMGASERAPGWKEKALFPCKRRISDVPDCGDLCQETEPSDRVQIPELFQYSLRIPMFRLDMEDAMEYICRDSICVNLSRILGRAGLTGDEQEEVLKDIGEEGHGNESIPYVRLAEVKRNSGIVKYLWNICCVTRRRRPPGLQDI